VFNDVFIKEVRNRGRINELKLVLAYKVKSGSIFSLQKLHEDINTGILMLTRHKLKIFAPKRSPKKEILQIFRNIVSLKSQSR